jgi:M3 family oligoendopeptidase
MTAVDFQDIEAPAPTYEDAVEHYAQFEVELDAAIDSDACVTVIRRWDTYVRRLCTWQALVHLRFNQDTTNEAYKAARDYCDELEPKLTDLSVQLKRKILASRHRDNITGQIGDTALALWQSHVTTYDPVIEEDVVAELKLEAEYIELTASARIPLRGETYNISEIAKFSQKPDRELRHQARRATWQWFADNREALDRIFDEMVQLRTGMAKKLGFADFVGLGYKRMCRIDYEREDVNRYRAAVRDHVVPLALELRKHQATQLSLDKLYEWDLALHDPRGNPKPGGDHDWMLDRAQEMFDGMGSGIDSFFEMMRNSHLLDLKIREGKGGGGFCTGFPSYGLPYIFANFNGTKGDVEVFTHEMGHAFQTYLSRSQPLTDYLWPTMESCEIHSMSLEFLAWPHMEKFFGDDAERFRQMHLIESLLFLPYGVSVDHFQHLVYETPNASPEERFGMWQDVERMYLPEYDYGDMEHAAQGGRWQLQRHIYLNPFYYIDYTLALTCALQFWEQSQQNYAEAMDKYVALCRRGGEAPFQSLAKSAGLKSPFESGCLEGVVNMARETLGL